MRMLLDTCVLAEILRPSGSDRVKQRVASVRDVDLYVSVITVGEIAQGIEFAEPGKKRDRYASFLSSMQQDFEDRILPVDVEIAQIWGRLAAAHRRRGRVLSVPDGLIAASAIRHGMSVMTRNVKDFESTGAMLVNPWDEG